MARITTATTTAGESVRVVIDDYGNLWKILAESRDGNALVTQKLTHLMFDRAGNTGTIILLAGIFQNGEHAVAETGTVIETNDGTYTVSGIEWVRS